MLRVLYAGSPNISATVLERLLFGGNSQIINNNSNSSEISGKTSIEGYVGKQEGVAASPYQIVGVLTNPPSTKGRHKTLTPTPVAKAALSRNIKIFTPQHLDAALRTDIASLEADILVCFAYGHIFGPKFLALFPMGGINLHPSLLPRYRGPAPVPAAILNRDSETAVTVQKISIGMDEGNILVQDRIALKGTETAEELLETCAQKGANLLIQILKDAAACGALNSGTPQTGKTCYTKIITKEDARIDWTTNVAEIDAHIRAYSPSPGAWTVYNGEAIKILKAHIADDATASNAPGTVLRHKKGTGIMVQTGCGVLAVTILQKPGKKAMNDGAFINGEHGFIGTVLGKAFPR